MGAASDAHARVPALGGRVQRRIPIGSKSGNRLQLHKRGLPGSPAGNHIVTLQIVTPEPKSEPDWEY